MVEPFDISLRYPLHVHTVHLSIFYLCFLCLGIRDMVCAEQAEKIVFQ